jgi:uncharacterized membrane protein
MVEPEPASNDNERTPDEPRWVTALHDRLGDVERLLSPLTSVDDVVREAGAKLVPAWRRITQGEPRWPVSLAVLVAIALQLSLPQRFAVHPRWLLPAAEFVLLIGLIIANPRRINRQSAQLRAASMVLIAVMSIANAWSAGHLVHGLLQHSPGLDNATDLLRVGAAIWLTNVIVFALWYWELDRGGPVARAMGAKEHPDFLFPQMQSPDMAPPDWEPGFADYLYLSFTNATAFSPTDVLPLSRWAKMTMLAQSAVSLVTVALVIARAVNIL